MKTSSASSAPPSPCGLVESIHYRHVVSEDWHRLQLFHRRLSANTIYKRFHAAKRELTTPLAHYFADLDGRNNVAIIATTGTRGRIVGVARYYRLDDHQAEVAFVVEDAFQHHGIGTRLMRRLREKALANGITEFVAEVLPENSAMLRLLEKTGPTTRRIRGGVCEALLDLTAAVD